MRLWLREGSDLRTSSSCDGKDILVTSELVRRIPCQVTEQLDVDNVGDRARRSPIIY